MRRMLAVSLAVVVALGALAQGTLSLTDQTGRAVEIPLPVERVVCLYGVATMYLYALGVQDKVVLATYVGLKPGSPSWEALKAVDPGLPGKYTRNKKPSLEEILAREPDLVVANPVVDPKAADSLEPFGIPVIYIRAETVAEIKEATALLGKAFGAEDRAARLIAYLDDAVKRIGDALTARELPRPAALFIGTRPTRVASGDMYQTELIRLAGGTPVAAGLSGYWQDVDLEQILLWDPEVIFIAPYGKVMPADLLGDPVWQSIRAVRRGRVYKMPRVFSPWDVPTPESFLGLLWMADKLHPELGIDISSEARSFYREFYGYELPEDVLAAIAG